MGLPFSVEYIKSTRGKEPALTQRYPEYLLVQCVVHAAPPTLLVMSCRADGAQGGKGNNLGLLGSFPCLDSMYIYCTCTY